MPTYRQISKFIEDDYGEVTIVFAVSDTYSGLYSLATATNVDVFTQGKTRHDLDIAAGVQAEDEIEFEMNMAAVDSTDDSDAIDFVLDAQSAANKRFVAVFINPADVDAPTTDELEFAGVVRQKMSATDVTWNDGEFGSAPVPTRIWRCSVQNFFEAAFDSISLPSVIAQIDSTWESANVADVLGYFSADIGGNIYQARFAALCNLNATMKKIRDIQEIEVGTLLGGTFTINLVDSALGFKLSPMRCVNPLQTQGVRYLNGAIAGSYSILANDAAEPTLGDGVGVGSLLSISYRMVKSTYADNPPGAKPEDWGFEALESFTDLIYAMALSLGCFAQFYYTDSTTLNVKLVSRAGVEKHALFIPDVTSADLDTQPGSESARDASTGWSWWHASEGNADTNGGNHYVYDSANGVYTESDVTKEMRAKKGERLFFSVAPTLRAVGMAVDQVLVGNAAIPHNCRFYKNGNPEAATDPKKDARGLTTALYVNTVGNGETDIDNLTDISLPAAALHAKIDSVDEVFYSLHEYVNVLRGRDENFYDTEYQLRIPHLCRYRKAQDGSHADDDGGRGRWQNLVLGVKITLDGIDYIVIGIERALDKPETTLRLHYRSRFAFTEASGLLADVDPPAFSNVPTPGLVLSKVTYKDHTAGDDMEDGDMVYMHTDGKVYRADADATAFGKRYGVAGNDAGADDPVRVYIDGLVESVNYSFTPGQRLYLRTTTVGTPNVSATALAAKDADEDLFLAVGVAVTSTSFRLEFSRERVYE